MNTHTNTQTYWLLPKNDYHDDDDDYGDYELDRIEWNLKRKTKNF